jgi:hypothetical protein
MQRLHMTGREHLSKRGEVSPLFPRPVSGKGFLLHVNPNRPFEMT